MESPLPPVSIKKLTKEALKKNEEDDEFQFPNDRLREGRYLPKNLKEDNISYVPIEDFDPHYANQQTFCVLGYKDLIYRFSSSNSLCILSPLNLLRRSIIYLLTHWVFAAFITTVVFLNCLLLLCPIKSWGLALAVEITFLSIYLMELIFIFIGRGAFLDPFTALRSIWTWIDITVIVLGIVACGTQSDKVAGLAALRILKVIPYIPALRVTADFVFAVSLQLLEVFLYSIVAISGFAIAGMHLFSGSLTQKCIADFSLKSQDDTNTLDAWSKNPANWLVDSHGIGHHSVFPYKLCGNESGSIKCPDLYTCNKGYGTNPGFGYTTFDSFPWAVFSTMRIICQDTLDVLYQQILETAGGLPRNTLFFVKAFVLGTFTLFCFTVAIVGKALLERKEYPADKEETFEEMGKTPTAIVQMDEDGNVAGDDTDDKTTISSIANVYQIICGWNCDVCVVVRDKLNLLISHPIYEYIMIFIILLDIFLLSCYYYGIELSKSRDRFLYIMQLVFFSFYIKDTLLKLIALSPKVYFCGWWNTFDFFIAILAIINTAAWTRALHNILLLRMLKLVPKWGAASWMARIMGNSIKRFHALFVFVFMYMFMFALIGKHMFAKDYEENKKVFPNHQIPRWNFSDLCHSFLMVFRILCGEWIASLWDCMLVARQSCRLYFFSAVLFGNVILVILFAAVIFSAFDALRYVDSILHPKMSTLEWMTSVVQKLKEQPNLLKMQIKKNKTAQEVIFVEMGDDPAAQAADEPKEETRNPLQNSWEEFQGSAKALMENKYFNGASILVIAASSIPLAFDETVRQPGATWGLHYADIMFTTYFLIEVMVLKTVSLGFIKCITSIAWIFDFLMILEMILTLGFYFPYGASFPSRGYLCIRCLRAMMMISRVERLKVVAQGIYNQLKFILDFIQAGIYLWLVFAIVGVHLFNGKFLACIDNKGEIVPYEVIKSKTDCKGENVSWNTDAENNFDRIDKSFVSLTHVASFDNWVDIVEHAVDIRGKTAQPDLDANFGAYYYFITFIIMGVFFTFSILIGASRYYLYRETYSKVFMTSDQLNSYLENDKKENSSESFTALIPELDIIPFNILYKIANSELFDFIVMGFIILDVIGMGLNDYGSSPTRKLVLYWVYFSFTMVFILELKIKLCAWRQFFLMSPWNIIDSIIIVYSFISLFVSDFLHYSMVVRTIRILRFFQLQVVRRLATRTRSFFRAMFVSYSAFVNLILLFLVFLFSFAVLGMALFKNVKLNVGLNEVVNFQTFWGSILLLFKICSFSGWSAIYQDVTNPFDCIPEGEGSATGNCGDQFKGRVYIYGCLIISYIIVMNMYSVIIFEAISQMKKLDSSSKEDDSEEPPQPIQSISASIQEFPKEATDIEEEAAEEENVFEQRAAETEETPEEEPPES